MPVGVKICGLSTRPALEAAIVHGASHVGFVFYPPSPRHVALDQAASLGAALPPHVRRVGVFVAPEVELLERAVATGQLDVVQLHNVAPAALAGVRARLGIELWAALPVHNSADLAAASSYRGVIDRIVYDAKTPPGALPGGMGMRFDWQLLRGFAHPLPWALSGGLDADNVGEAIRVTGANLVDVSSGVESAPGVKDVDKIAAFLKGAHSA